MVHVPYKGGGPAVVDLMAGQVQLGFVGMPTAMAHAKAGRLKFIAVTDGKRAVIGLSNAPGTLRVIDGKTIYLRMPQSFLEPETALMVLRNLMRQAYDRELKGETLPEPGKAPAP